MKPLTSKLIAREFYMHRWMLGGSIVAGLIALAVAARGGHMNFNIGFLIWLTTIVAFGAVIAMFGVATERKERVLNWVLSLPISHGDYVRIKALALLLCYFVPWFVLSASAVVLIGAWQPTCRTGCCRSGAAVRLHARELLARPVQRAAPALGRAR